MSGLTVYNGYYTVSGNTYTYHDVEITDQFILPEGYSLTDELGTKVTLMEAKKAYTANKMLVSEAYWGSDADNLFGAGTFAEALANANSDATVKYISLQSTVNNFDIKASVSYIHPAAGELTIDLNGQTLYCSNSNAFLFDVNSACTITLTDSSATEENPAGFGVVDAKTYTSGDYGIFFVRNSDAKFIINGGTYITARRMIYSRSGDGGTVTINGGVFDAGSYVAVRESGTLIINGGEFYAGTSAIDTGLTATTVINGGTFTSRSGYAIQNNGGSLTINNATVYGVIGAVGCYSGTTIIENGSFMPSGANGRVCHVLYVEESASVTVNGGVFKMNYSSDTAPDGGYAIASYLNGMLTINGGSFISHFDDTSPVELSRGATIKGGSFLVHSGAASLHTNVTDFIAEGYKLYENGSVEIAKTYVAEINGVKYETVDEALSLAAVGSVITIIGDVDVDSIVAPEGTYLGKSADSTMLILLPGDYVVFKGSSIRYILANGTPKGYDNADIRFSYVFSDEFDFLSGSWGWNYKLGETRTGSIVGSYYDSSNMTNLVFTNVNFDNFEKNIAAQLWFKVTVDGIEFTVCDEYRIRTVIEVVNGVADYQGEGYEQAKIYAIKLRDEYIEYKAKKEEENQQ